MNNQEENLLGLNSQYQDQVRKCNMKYDELVREYKTNHPSENSNFWTKILVFILSFSCICISCYSCIGSCSGDWLNCSSWEDMKTIMDIGLESGFEFWFETGGVKILFIAGIIFLFTVCEKLISKTRNNRIENSINALECERKRELDKLQEKYEHDKRKIIARYNQSIDIYHKQSGDIPSK